VQTVVKYLLSNGSNVVRNQKEQFPYELTRDKDIIDLFGVELEIKNERRFCDCLSVVVSVLILGEWTLYITWFQNIKSIKRSTDESTRYLWVKVNLFNIVLSSMDK